jgi:hypothetical protein
MTKPAARERLWSELSWLFEDDDGSLPEVRLRTSSPDATARIFEKLYRRSTPLASTQTVWHNERRQEVAVSALSDPGTLAVRGVIGPLHIVARGIRSAEVGLPDLGVSVDPDGVAIDYRMGDTWNPDVLAAFVELIGELLALDPKTRVDLEDFAADDVRNRFRLTVAAYLAAPPDEP